MGTRRDLSRDFVEMPLHGLGITVRQDEARADTALGTDGTEDIGRFRALVLGRCWSGSSPRPTPCDLGFLAHPGLILPPNLYLCVGWELGADFFQLGGKVFLKSSMANSFCPL